MMDDFHLREIALSKAVMAPDDMNPQPEDVVKRAEAYYKFLKGESPSGQAN